MPSDPTGAQPLGVLVRPAPDFFDDNIGTGAYYLPDNSGALNNYYATVALYNNANTGIAFKVYGISISSDGGGGWGFWYAPGPVGSLVQNCQPIRPDLGMPNGQIYAQNMTGVVSRPNDFYTGLFAFMIAAGGFDGHNAFPGFPLAVVPVGWSLVGTNIAPTDTVTCSFWYQQSNE
jgi:hypothetical protein